MSSDLSAGEAIIAGGAQLIKIEDDRMTSLAIARNRDELAVKAAALKELDDDPGYAAAIYYSIPQKIHTRRDGCTGRSDDKCPEAEPREGIGIEGARNLARRWGNNVSRVLITSEDENWVNLTGVFVDYETNQKIELPIAVNKLGTRRDGSVYALGPDRMAQAIGAATSKVARNAILAAIPAQIKRPYFDRARELSTKVSVDIPALLESFKLLGVTREQIEGQFGGTAIEAFDDVQKRAVRSLFVAIREKLIDPAEHFASDDGGDPVAAAAAPSTAAPAAAAEVVVDGAQVTAPEPASVVTPSDQSGPVQEAEIVASSGAQAEPNEPAQAPLMDLDQGDLGV